MMEVTAKEFLTDKEKVIKIIEEYRDSYYDDDAEQIYEECIKEIKKQKIADNEKIIIARKEYATYLECADKELCGLHVVVLDNEKIALSTDGISYVSINDVIYESERCGIIILTEEQLNEYCIDLEELEEGNKEAIEEFLNELNEDNKVAYIICFSDVAGKLFPERLIIFKDYGKELNEKILDAILDYYEIILGRYEILRFDEASERLQTLAVSVDKHYYSDDEIIKAIKEVYLRNYAEKLISELRRDKNGKN